MSAGKGDKLRKGANLKAYWNNYDAVFGRGQATPPKTSPLEQAIELLTRCRDSAGRMDLDLYNEIQEFLHENS